MKVDVLVVGGGPAGLAAAARAALAGSVLVAHRDREIGRPVRTSGASWKNHLDELQIPPALYHELDSLLFSASGRNVVTRFGADRPVVLDVTGTYRHLAQLATQAGAEVSCDTTFQRIARQDAGGVVCVTSREGEEREVAARFVIDASGHHRAVVSQVGGPRRPERIAVGVEHEYRNIGTDPRRAVLFVGSEFAPSGYGWIFPTGAGTVRVGVGVIRPDTKASPADLLGAFLRSEQARAMGLDVGELLEKHFGAIPSDGAMSCFVHGRVVSAGDSAGQALALVGEGIRYSIEAGRRAGDALARALAEPAGEASDALAGYEAWWDGRYRRRFALAQLANERMGAFGDAEWDVLASLLDGLSGDDVAALLRVEFGKMLAARLALKGGRRAARFFLRSL